jgi:uncharacterized protein (DUF2141 family)/5'-deoxynucleotidase YfbR-like HD superfamily hydrolase
MKLVTILKNYIFSKGGKKMLIKEHTKLQLSVLLAFILIFSTFASAFAAPASQFYDSETGRELTLSQVLEGIKDKSIKYENLYKIDGERYINLKELSDAEEQAILAYMTQSGKELSDIIESIKNGDQEVLNGLANLVAEETAKVEAKTKEDLTPLKIESVNAINGKVTVEFNKEVTELPEGLVVLKDGEALELEADAFVVVEGKVEITVPLIEATEEEQTIVYSVKLGEAKAVAAEAVVIPAREKTDVEKVEAMIEALPEVKDLTKEDISKVGEARDAYEKLSEEQKAQVKNYDKLDALLKEAEKIYNQDLANIVIEMIANLDPTSETFAESVATAREAYDGLTPEQKELVTNYDLLVAAEESLKSVTVVKVSAIDKTKVVTVKATAPNAEEGATANVAIFAYDEEGVRGETAVATETDVEIVEGAIEVEFETLETGSYVAVVTVGEEEAELDFTLDFKAVDAAVDAVNKADTQIKLRDALNKPEFFDGVNNDLIVKYFDKMKEKTYKTIAEIQKDIDTVNEEAGAEDLVAEIETALEVKDQIKLYELLSGANFVDEDENPIVVDADLIGLYETKLNGITEGLSVDKIKAAILEVNNEPINAVNNANSADEMKTAIEKYAERLGLATGEGSDYAKLIPGRDRSVSVDLYNNRQYEEDGKYTLERLQAIFNDIVATRLVTQASMDLVNKADELQDIGYVTMLLDRFKEANYTQHSSHKISDKIDYLQGLVDRYDALEGEKVTINEEVVDAQKAVLDKIIEAKNDGFRRSEHTTDALENALNEVEELIAPQKATEAVHALFATKVEDGKEVIDETKLAEGVTQADIDAASKLVEALPDDKDKSTKAGLQELIDKAQELFDVKSINDAIAAEDAVTLQNLIVELNVTEFVNLTKDQRAEIGAFMIRESKGEDYEEVTSTTDFADNVETAITLYLEKIGAFNTAANKEYPGTADDKAAVIAAIKDVMDLEGLTAIEELDLAEAIFEAKPEDGYAVRTIAEIKAIVEANL